MLLDLRNHLHFKSLRWVIPAAFLVLLAFPATLRAQSEDFDDYKIRLETFWFYSNPSGTIQGQGDTVAIDLVKDLNFNTYSTFAGKVDWKFTRKNHFYVAFSPFRHDAANDTYHRFSRTDLCGGFDSAERSPFLSGRAQLSIRHHQAETWASRAGCTVQSFRYNSKNKRGPQVINGQQHAAVSASNTLLAPIPVAGPVPDRFTAGLC